MKTARRNALFSCSVLAGGRDDSDELAVVLGVGGSKATLLGDLRLVWTRSTLLVCSIVQGERVGGCFCEIMDGFSSFSSFWVKLTVVGRVLSAIVVIEHSTGFRIAPKMRNLNQDFRARE